MLKKMSNNIAEKINKAKNAANEIRRDLVSDKTFRQNTITDIRGEILDDVKSERAKPLDHASESAILSNNPVFSDDPDRPEYYKKPLHEDERFKVDKPDLSYRELLQTQFSKADSNEVEDESELKSNNSATKAQQSNSN